MPLTRTIPPSEMLVGNAWLGKVPGIGALDSRRRFVVALTHHPYRFGGRVEAALRGGLCRCKGLAWESSDGSAEAGRTPPFPGLDQQGLLPPPPALMAASCRIALSCGRQPLETSVP